MAIGTPSLLGSTSTGNVYDQTALSLAASAIASGSLVAVFAGCYSNQDASSTNPIVSVVEGSNNYSLAVAGVAAGNLLFYQIWYFYYASGVPTPTITVNWAAKNNRIKVLQAVSISGITPTSPLNITNTSTGTGTSASTASGTLSQPEQIILAGIFADGSTSYLANSPFTNSYNNTTPTAQRFTLDYDSVNSTSSVTSVPSWSGSVPYTAVMASFKGVVANTQTLTPGPQWDAGSFKTDIVAYR